MLLNNFIKAACLSTCLGLASGSLLANTNYNLDTRGGITVYDKNDNRFWFKLNGLIKFDQTFFHGNKKFKGGKLDSSANLRSVQTKFNGGIGRHTSYNLDLSSDSDGRIKLNSARVNYSGLNRWTKFSIGQINSPYGLEKSNAGSASTFLEKSIATNVFSPSSGLGVSVSAWTDKLGLSWAVTQPAQGVKVNGSDKIATSVRLCFAPINKDNTVLHLGASGKYHSGSKKEVVGQNNATDAIRFKSVIEAQGRDTSSQLDTGRVNASSYNTIGLDVAFKRGPVFLQAEYHRSHLHLNNVKVEEGKEGEKVSNSVNVYGWNVQASYVLTGETRGYNYRTGGFSGINPEKKSGAWEVGLRHGYVNLNKNLDSKSNNNIEGGSAHSLGASVAWSVNQNIKVLANYIHAPVTPPKPLCEEPVGKNTLGTLALRLQATW